MAVKLTLRIPEPLMAKLRDQSRREGRSLNETAALVFERGLGGSGDEGWLALGSLVETQPSATFVPADLDEMRSRLGDAAHGLQQDLDWVRGEP
jgi:hypothetical protein